MSECFVWWLNIRGRDTLRQECRRDTTSSNVCLLASSKPQRLQQDQHHHHHQVLGCHLPRLFEAEEESQVLVWSVLQGTWNCRASAACLDKHLLNLLLYFVLLEFQVRSEQLNLSRRSRFSRSLNLFRSSFTLHEISSRILISLWIRSRRHWWLVAESKSYLEEGRIITLLPNVPFSQKHLKESD